MRIVNVLFAIILGAMAALWQLAVSPLMWGEFIGIGIPILAVMIFFAKRPTAMAYIVSWGVFVDAYSFSHEWYTARLLLLSVLAALVSHEWLTNRSWYAAAALGMALGVGEGLTRYALLSLFGEVHRMPALTTIGGSIAWNAAWSAVLFFLVLRRVPIDASRSYGSSPLYRL